MEKKKKNSFLKILISLVGLLSLVGCSRLTFDTNEIIKAPKISAEYEQLKRVIEQNEKCKISLILPQTLTDPENSAIKIKDDLAIVSFNFDGEAYGCVSILKKENDKWKLISTLKKNLYLVDMMSFADLNGNGDVDVIVTWLNNGSRKSAISVYDKRGILIDEINSSNGTMCKNITLCDINSDGKLEVLAFFSQPYKDFVKAYCLNEKFIEISQCEIRKYIKYFAITAGHIDDQHVGIFLDGDYYDSKEYFCTDVIYWSDGKLVNISQKLFDSSIRFINEKSRDIDGDGIIEVPSIEELYDFEQYGNKNPGVSIIWKKWSTRNDKSVAVKNKSYVYNNYARYAIMMPDRWFNADESNAVLALIDNGEKNMVFNVKRSNTPLFEIKIFTIEAWKEADLDAYKEITTADNLVYAVKYLSNNDLNISIDELKFRFVFL